MAEKATELGGDKETKAERNTENQRHTKKNEI